MRYSHSSVIHKSTGSYCVRLQVVNPQLKLFKIVPQTIRQTDMTWIYFRLLKRNQIIIYFLIPKQKGHTLHEVSGEEGMGNIPGLTFFPPLMYIYIIFFVRCPSLNGSDALYVQRNCMFQCVDQDALKHIVRLDA